MITLLLIFFIIASLFILIFTQTFKLLLPIIIFTIIYMIGLVIYRYKKYGIKEFQAFKSKKDIPEFKDIINSMLIKMNTSNRIVYNSNFNSDIILVNKTGIYLFKTKKYSGFITGKRNESILDNNIGKVSIEKENPFLFLDGDYNKLKKYFLVPIYTILITNNKVNINIDDVSKEEIVNIKDFYYVMRSRFVQENVIEENEISNICEKISKIID